MSNLSHGATDGIQGRGRNAAARDSTIGDHALRLAVQIQRLQPQETPGWWIFQFLGRMVASCVFHDCVRNRRGRVRDIFSVYYQFSLELMLEKFCDSYWPCSFVDRSGRRCASTRRNHDPVEHCTSKSKVIGTGFYETDFTAASYGPEWICYLKKEINACQEEYWDALDETPLDISKDRIAADLHLEQINDSYADLGNTQSFVSHNSCFCCLVETPLHPLPCGHVLCSACVQDYGYSSQVGVELDYCPMHTYTSFSPSWEVTFEPEHAGVRVLSLDGGGMRGIVELEVLRAIEKILGDDIPIQAFFDLIVGTSTGGINALALGVKQWPVRYCISKFETFCDQAFTEREFGGIFGLEHAAVLNHGSIYKAKPLHNAFQETVGRSPLFGGNASLNAFRTKVAVTATSGTGKEAVIIANYNRPQDPADSHVFVRPEDPSNELEVWEAAAATSAAPFYFKPFVHSKTGESYLDGGLYHNNPVHVANRERKMLWPGIASSHPDLLLSVGTGQNLTGLVGETSEQRSPESKTETRTKSHWRKPSGVRRAFQTFEAIYQRFDNILDSEQTWTEFEADIDNPQSEFPSPYVRFNLDLKRKPPPFDAKDRFKELRKDVRERLKDSEVLKLTNHVACLLVASSFYLRMTKVVPRRGGRFTCTGIICCRFEEGSSHMRALGGFLRKYTRLNFAPHFVIQDLSNCSQDRGKRVELTNKTISRMAIHGMFRLHPIDIEIFNPIASTTISLALQRGREEHQPQRYLLSGFPRVLMKDMSCKSIERQNAVQSARPKISTREGKAARTHNHQTRPANSNAPPTPDSSSRTHRTIHAAPKRTQSKQPCQAAIPSHVDSAIELPQSLRVCVPPEHRISYETTSKHQMLRSCPHQRALEPACHNAPSKHRSERSVRQEQEEGVLRKVIHRARHDHSSRPKGLAKKKDAGKVFVEIE